MNHPQLNLLARCGTLGRRPFLLVVAIGAVLYAGLLAVSGRSYRAFTCAVCRADRVAHHWVVWNWYENVETDCSRWYPEHVERLHEHVWVNCPHGRRVLFGGYACTMGAPIAGLSPTVQVEIYKRFDNPLDAKRLFVRLQQRDDESYRMWDSLMEWVDSGYRGTWQEWWKTHPNVDDIAASEE